MFSIVDIANMFFTRFSFTVRNGDPGPAASAQHQTRSHAHVEDIAEYRQSRRVLQRAAHALFQRSLTVNQ